MGPKTPQNLQKWVQRIAAVLPQSGSEYDLALEHRFGIDFLSVVAFIFGTRKDTQVDHKSFKNEDIFEIDFRTIFGTVSAFILDWIGSV